MSGATKLRCELIKDFEGSSHDVQSVMVMGAHLDAEAWEFASAIAFDELFNRSRR